ncbi:hypothetical protein Q4575_06770 [Psychrosphaera sp. 1_MG-2023]|uniref:Uncharacterized protein n=1 Tax=Psychrosphaera algicola TaxID=3023714 RepID=A0ABT5FGF4_9GAMM|nr:MULTISPECIES: hypothetical protein [unclassified Psychrosphaera]MDC2890269.1 hypothetical protein [Psychrosphaera sp. G1-22]MDO6719094.1 hypothetical protein [Psychrosphaera sp. 1_MG-2023]
MNLPVKRVFFSLIMFTLCLSVVVAKENINPNAIAGGNQLAQYTANYKILRKGKEYGKATRTLIHTNGVYKLELTSKLSAFFTIFALNKKEEILFV